VKYKLMAAASLIAAFVLLGVQAAAGPAAVTRAVSCTYRLTAQIEPGSTVINPTAPTGHDFGFVSCGGPFGDGVQADGFTATFTSSTTGKISGPFKDFFDTGTTHGTYRLTFVATSATKITYTGTAIIAGGTGALSHVTGNVKLQCSSNDGIHTLCKGKVKLT